MADVSMGIIRWECGPSTKVSGNERAVGAGGLALWNESDQEQVALAIALALCTLPTSRTLAPQLGGQGKSLALSERTLN